MALHESHRNSSFEKDSSSFNKGKSTFHHTWRALGSPCRVSVVHEDKAVFAPFLQSALTWLDQFEKTYSRFLPDSLVSKINAQAGSGEWIPLDDEAEGIFDLCESLNFTTKGAIDPTMGPLVSCWYKASEQPNESKIKEARTRVGWGKVERRNGAVRLPKVGMSLDFGCFGKEYATDQIALIAEAHGIENYLIDLGRDLRTRGCPAENPFWQIGIEDPASPEKVLLAVGLNENAIAASGNYRQYVEFNGIRYGHIIDPRTGYPVVNSMRAAHVIASSCLQAGILSTSVFVLGAQDGLDLIDCTFNVEALLITETNFFQSRLFPDYIVRSNNK